MSRSIDLSIIVVSHNNLMQLPDCLESLRRNSEGISTEVLVVDCASTDGTPGMVRKRFPEVILEACPDNLGFSAGNNVALKRSRGRYVLLLNPDTIVHEDALRTMINHLESNQHVGAVGPKLQLGDGSIQPECARQLPKLSNMPQWLLLLDKIYFKCRYRDRPQQLRTAPPRPRVFDGFNLLFWHREQTCAVECLCGACMMMRSEAVEQVGLLDETSPLYLDDIDYCRRLRDAGWELHFVAEATITHLWEQSTTKLDRVGDLFALQCHAIWLYFRKHEGDRAAAMFSGIVALAAICRIIICSPLRLVTRGATQQEFRRRTMMGFGLSRWVLRWPKSPPRFGFACESSSVNPQNTVRSDTG